MLNKLFGGMSIIFAVWLLAQGFIIMETFDNRQPAFWAFLLGIITFLIGIYGINQED